MPIVPHGITLESIFQLLSDHGVSVLKGVADWNHSRLLLCLKSMMFMSSIREIAAIRMIYRQNTSRYQAETDRGPEGKVSDVAGKVIDR